MKSAHAYIYMTLLLFSLSGGCTIFRPGHALQELSPEKFRHRLEKMHGILIDVRTAEEYREERIPGAININVEAGDFNTNIDRLNRDKPYFLYCKAGKRSTLAGNIMKEKGFRKVYSLKGGIQEWKKAHLPVTSDIH